MNILVITIFVYDLWFLRYRECPYSDTFPTIHTIHTTPNRLV